MLSHFSCIQLFVTPRTLAHQAMSMGFPRQKYWNGLPFPAPGDLPDSGTKPCKPYVSCIGRWVLYRWYHLGSVCIPLLLAITNLANKSEAGL